MRVRCTYNNEVYDHFRFVGYHEYDWVEDPITDEDFKALVAKNNPLQHWAHEWSFGGTKKRSWRKKVMQPSDCFVVCYSAPGERVQDVIRMLSKEQYVIEENDEN